MNSNSFEIKIRVRYGETDQMGFVYYGNYALYLEQARTEMLRSVGFSYKEMESSGIMLPVVNLNIRYKNAAKYDDLICVKTCIKEKPTKKIIFESKLYNEANLLLNQSEVVLVFMNQKKQLIYCPEHIVNALKPYIKS